MTAAVALLGPLTGGPIEYHVGETLRKQTIGLDAASLFVVAPLALAAALPSLRGHVAGPAIALGVGAYAAYMFVQYIVGPEYLTRRGNNELLFPLYLGLVALGWAARLSLGGRWRRSTCPRGYVRASWAESCSRSSRSSRSHAPPARALRARSGGAAATPCAQARIASQSRQSPSGARSALTISRSTSLSAARSSLPAKI
jgi:hypothetical protein